MQVWVIGAGGHAKVVIDALRRNGESVCGVIDDSRERIGTRWLDLPVVGPIAPDAVGDGCAVIAIGSNRARSAIAERLAGTSWHVALHPSAIVGADVMICGGAMVMAGTVLQASARIGAHTIVNTGASVDHDCEVGAFVHVAPHATLCGNVTVGEGAFVGAGATVLPGIRIGAWATVGAGAVVVRDVPDGATVVGIPARTR